MDRLDPHRARPGRDRPLVRQVGRPAGVARSGARIAAPRDVARRNGAARPRVRQSRRAHAGGAARRAAAAGQHDALRARGEPRARRRAHRRSCGAAALGEASAAADRARVAQRRRMGRARRAGRSARRRRRHRSQGRRGLSDRPSAARRRAGHPPPRRRRESHRRRGRHPEPRLGRSRRNAAHRVRRRACSNGDSGFAGPRAAQRLEHGPSSASARRRIHRGRAGCRGPRAAAGARRCECAACPPPSRSILRAGAVRERRAHDRRSRACAARGARRPPRLARPSSSVVERRQLAVSPSARFPRLRRRRRHRRGTRHRRWRRACAARHGGVARRHLRRRRFPDGRDRVVDRRPLPDSRC